MRALAGRNRVLLAAALCALAAIAAPSAEGATARHCGRIVNPYPDTRYEGVDLRRIRASGVSCNRARRVARGAHRRALRIRPRVSGVRRLSWHGWHVTGDLHGPSDRYVAKRDGKRVSWRF
jgi:hypothetical protein